MFLLNLSAMKFHKLVRFSLKSFCIFGIIFTSTIIFYSSNSLFPTETYRKLLIAAYESNLINTQVTERAPAGWGADKATECLTLGLGLSNSKFQERLLDFFPNGKGSYNPCVGVIAWATNNDEFQYVSYARYWHVHSEILRWLVLIFGVSGTRAMLAMLILSSCLYLCFIISNLVNSKSRSRLIIFPLALGIMYFFSGLFDIQASMTHALSELTILLIIISSLRILSPANRSSPYFCGFAMGGIYVVSSYMINPQSIPVAILTWGLIPLMLFTTKSQEEAVLIWKRALHLFLGIGVGYLTLWFSKWIAIDLLTEYPIWNDVASQAEHRSSQDVSSLSVGVGKHLRFADDLPASVQSVIANFSALAIRVWDPRHSNVWALVIILLLVSTGLLGLKKFLARELNQIGFSKGATFSLSSRIRHSTYALLASFVLLVIWYTSLAQHSFDHSTYTYRSLSYLVSGTLLVLLSYWSTSPNVRNLNDTSSDFDAKHRQSNF